MSEPRLCVILTGGSGAPTTPLPGADLVIAADSGLHLAARLGLRVDVIVGDFDSADPDRVAAAIAAGAAVERHPVDKEATDLDLALDAAARRGATRTIVVGGAGDDRIDHVLANAGVIAATRHSAIAPEWWVGPMQLWPTRGQRIVEGTPGDLVSIVPVAGDAVVTASGLRWPLAAEALPFGSSRGVSNTMTANTAVIEIHEGVAMVAYMKEVR